MTDEQKKCKFCNRRTDIRFGWEQPLLENIYGNVVKELELKAVIYDYKTTTPVMVISTDKFFTLVTGEYGIATMHIPIHYCPICGRELGKRKEQ